MKEELPERVTLPGVRVPGLAPGDTLPELAVTPTTVPVPPRVPPLIVVVPVKLPLTSSVPVVMLVALWVLVSVSIKVPGPVLVSVREPPDWVTDLTTSMLSTFTKIALSAVNVTTPLIEHGTHRSAIIAPLSPIASGVLTPKLRSILPELLITVSLPAPVAPKPLPSWDTRLSVPLLI